MSNSINNNLTDNDYAEAIRTAIEILNKTIRTAVDIGLKVELDLSDVGTTGFDIMALRDYAIVTRAF